MDNMTRSVITDLWPLYISGDVSPDTRRFVETALSQDPEFARELQQSGGDVLPAYVPPALQPDHELKTLARLKRRLGGPFGCYSSPSSFHALLSAGS
jgi:hypothetical protein